MNDVLDLFSGDNIVIIIFVLNLVFRLYQKVATGDQVPEALRGEGEGEGDSDSKAMEVADDDPYAWAEEELLTDKQVTSVLHFVTDKLEEARVYLREIKSSSLSYEDIIYQHFPALNALISEQEIEVRELSATIRTLEAKFNESVNNEYIEQLNITKREVQQLLEALSAIHTVFSYLPAPKRLLEAHMLLQHDIAPFVANRYASRQVTKPQVIPLPLQAQVHRHELQKKLGHRISFYFVDLDHLDEPSLWPLFGRETPNLLAQLYPDWSAEWHTWRGGDRAVHLPAAHRRTLQWRVEASLNVWADKLLAVHLMTKRYGPTATIALIEEVEIIHGWESSSLVTVGSEVGKPQLQTKTPPPLLILEVSFETLRLNGYRREADNLEVMWRQHVGNELKIKVKNGKLIPFPLGLIVPEIKVWLERLQETSWKAWRDESLSAMMGLTLTRGQWAAVKNHTQQIIESDRSLVLPDDMRWVTFAHTAQRAPSQVAKVLKAAEKYHYDHTSWDSQEAIPIEESSRDDLIAAIVLADLLVGRPKSLVR